MDWGADLKQTLKIKKGRRASKSNTNTDESEQSNEKHRDSIPNDDSLSSIKFKRTGVWGDDDKSSKQNKQNSNQIELERFNSASSNSVISNVDEIPVIPDIDDITDDSFLNDVVNAPKPKINRVTAYKELDIDLGKQSALASLEDLDLSILAKSLQNDAKLDEPDVVWNWEQIFTEISSAIHDNHVE